MRRIIFYKIYIILYIYCINNINSQHLIEYITNSNKYTQETEEKKKLFLKLTNGGNFTKEQDKLTTDFEKQYSSEMKKLHEQFADLDEEAYKIHKKRRI